MNWNYNPKLNIWNQKKEIKQSITWAEKFDIWFCVVLERYYKSFIFRPSANMLVNKLLMSKF